MTPESKAFWKDVGRAALVLVLAGFLVRAFERAVFALPEGE